MALESTRTLEMPERLARAYASEPVHRVRQAILDSLGLSGSDRVASWLWGQVGLLADAASEEELDERNAAFKALLEITSRNRHRWRGDTTMRALEESLQVLVREALDGDDHPLAESAARGAARSGRCLSLTSCAWCGTSGRRSPHALLLASHSDRLQDAGAADVLEAWYDGPMNSAVIGRAVLQDAAAAALGELDPQRLAGVDTPWADGARARLAFGHGLLFGRPAAVREGDVRAPNRVFISYSRDYGTGDAWVREFAEGLRVGSSTCD